MSDTEVALELLRIVLEHEKANLATSENPRQFVFALYRDCLATVRGKEA